MKHHLIAGSTLAGVFSIILYVWNPFGKPVPPVEPVEIQYSPGEHPCSALARVCGAHHPSRPGDSNQTRRECFKKIFLTKTYGETVFKAQEVEACMAFRQRTMDRERRNRQLELSDSIE